MAVSPGWEGRTALLFCPGWCALHLEDFTLLGHLPRAESPRPVTLGERGICGTDTHLLLHSHQAQQCGSSGLQILEGSSPPGQSCPLRLPLIYWLHAPPPDSSCFQMQASTLLCVQFPASCEVQLLFSGLRGGTSACFGFYRFRGSPLGPAASPLLLPSPSGR